MLEAMQNLDVPAALWSAFAATFAAISTFLLWRTEQQSFRHSARPELILTGWKRKPDSNASSGPESIAFSAIENAGRGPALHVHIHSFSVADDNRPMTMMGEMLHESFIAMNSHAPVEGEIRVWLKNVAGSPGSKSVPISINIFCWDTTGMRYLTKYKLVMVELSPTVHVSHAIAPGVMLMTRTVTVASVWKLKMNRQLSKVPVIGRAFRGE